MAILERAKPGSSGGRQSVLFIFSQSQLHSRRTAAGRGSEANVSVLSRIQRSALFSGFWAVFVDERATDWPTWFPRAWRRQVFFSVQWQGGSTPGGPLSPLSPLLWPLFFCLQLCLARESRAPHHTTTSNWRTWIPGSATDRESRWTLCVVRSAATLAAVRWCIMDGPLCCGERPSRVAVLGVEWCPSWVASSLYMSRHDPSLSFTSSSPVLTRIPISALSFPSSVWIKVGFQQKQSHSLLCFFSLRFSLQSSLFFYNR